MKNALLIVILLGGTASAEPVVIATQPIAFVTRGLEVSYEQQAASRLSWVALFGARLGAEGDYDSSTFMLGAELRWWPRSRTPMRGPFIAMHASAGRTTVSDQMGTIGASLGLTERIDLGWRWRVGRRVTLAPSLGLGAIEDVDETGRLATVVNPTIGFGFEVGCWCGS